MVSPNPRLEISLDKIRHNAQHIVNLAARQGIEVIGVTKGFMALPEIARAMLEGGVRVLADSRLENLEHLKKAGLRAPRMLLRLPRLSRVQDVLKVADFSLNSEVTVIKALDEAGRRLQKKHDCILMVDLGDLREGIWPGELKAVLREIRSLKWARIEGLGVNFACYGGVLPTPDKMQQMLELKKQAEAILDRPLPVLSGGNSSSLLFLLRGQIPPGISQLRIGEGILLGRESTQRLPIPGTYQDAFRVVAEVIELKEKPSVPQGQIGMDAFGRVPKFEDRGWRKRAILAIGRQDVVPEGLSPVDQGVVVLGASSDHLVVDVTDLDRPLAVGDELTFLPNYAALLAAVTSPFVQEVLVDGDSSSRAQAEKMSPYTRAPKLVKI